MHDEIDRHLVGRKYKRKVAFQSVDLNTGKVIIFDEDTPEKYQAKSVAASASIPGAF